MQESSHNQRMSQQTPEPNSLGLVLNNRPYSSSSSLLSPSSPAPKFYSSNEEDDDNEEATSKIIEESPNGRWSKLLSEISSQKLLDFDSANLAVDCVIFSVFSPP